MNAFRGQLMATAAMLGGNALFCSMSDMEMVSLGGENVSLADLAGIDFSNIKEKRAFMFPVGSYVFQVSADPEPPKLKKLGDGPAITFNLKCINVLEMKSADLKAEDVMGQIHRETFFISSLEDFGYVKAFLNDIGVPATKGNPLQLLMSAVDVKFGARIIHTPNRKDKDLPPYVNIDRSKGKIIPMVQRAA